MFLIAAALLAGVAGISALAGGGSPTLREPSVDESERPSTPLPAPSPAQVEEPASSLDAETGLAREAVTPAAEVQPAALPEQEKHGRSAIEDALDAARRYGKDEGLVIPLDVQLSAAVQGSIVDAHCALEKASADLHVVRQPILHALSQQKQARGEMEQVKTTRDMPTGLSAEEKRKWVREAAAVRKPTRPGQTLITVAQAGKTFIVRVDANEDSRLQVTHEQWSDAKKLFVQRVRLAIDTGR